MMNPVSSKSHSLTERLKNKFRRNKKSKKSNKKQYLNNNILQMQVHRDLKAS